MSAASSVPLVTSSVADSGYDLDADIAATLDAQDALEALGSSGEGGQTEFGVYQDQAEFDADQDDFSNTHYIAAPLIQPLVAYDHGSAHVDVPAVNGYDDFESASAAFARQCAAVASGRGNDQPTPSGSVEGTREQQPVDMNDASKRARAPTDSQSVTSEPRAAKRSPSRGPPPPRDASSSSGATHPVREVGQYAAGLPIIVPRFVPSAGAAPVALPVQPAVSDTSRDLLSEFQELRSQHSPVAPTLSSLETTVEHYQNEFHVFTHRQNEMFSELRSSRDANSLLESNALQAIHDLKRGEHEAAVASVAARQELKVQFDEQLATFRVDFQSRHDRAMLDARHEHEAQHVAALSELRHSAEVRHSEAMESATEEHSRRELTMQSSCSALRVELGDAQRRANRDAIQWAQEKVVLRTQVEEFSQAAAQAALNPPGGSFGVPPLVQDRLDSAVRCIQQSRHDVFLRDDQIRKIQVALQETRDSCSEHVKYRDTFAKFVDNRERDMLSMVRRFEQQIHMLETGHGHENLAMQMAESRCTSLEAELAASEVRYGYANHEVHELMQTPWSAPCPSLPQPSPSAPLDIRHPTLHLNNVRGVASSAQGARDVNSFALAHSQEEWYEGPCGVVPGNRHGASAPQHQPVQFSICGDDAAGVKTGPVQGLGLGFLGAAPPVFNSFQQGPGSRSSLPVEDPARRAPRAPPPAVAPGFAASGMPLSFGPKVPISSSMPSAQLLSQLSPSAAPFVQPPLSQNGVYAQPSATSHQQESLNRHHLQQQLLQQQQQQNQPPSFGAHAYRPSPGFQSLVPSDPGGGAGGGDAESSDYESACDDDPHDPQGSYLRRARVTRHWRTYREFNGSLTLSAIPDHASKFHSWRNHIRAEVVSVSKADHKAFKWILRVEDPSVEDDALRIQKKKWWALDAKLRSALMKIATGEVAKTFELLTEEERVLHQRQISGAFMLRIIYRRFQTKETLAPYYEYNDLIKVLYKSDATMNIFLMDWQSKLNGLQHPEYLHPDAKLEMFLKQVRSSPMMKYDMEHYRRLPEGHLDKTYEWVIGRIHDRLRDERNRVVESQLGHGAPPPPALAAPPGTVCQYFTKGDCKKGAECDMIHDKKAKKAYTTVGGGPTPKAGVDTPKAKAKPKAKPDVSGNSGKFQGAPGGNPASKYPCYANHSGKCVSQSCSHAHRPLTAEELVTMKAWEAKASSRASSPGAPASGVCPEFLKGSCILGASCTMEHPGEEAAKSGRKRAKAKAKSAADQ